MFRKLFSTKDARYYRDQATFKRKLQKYDNAITDYKKAIILDPNDANLYSNIGFCYLKMKKYDDAKNNFIKCLEIEDKFIDTMVGLSILYIENKDIVNSMLWINKAISLFPKLSEGLSYIKELESEDDGWVYTIENKDSLKKIFELI